MSSTQTRPRPRLVLLGAVVATLALAVAACSSSSGSSGGSGSGSSGGGAGGSVALVAYSTPQAAYKQLIAGFNGTTAGKGVSFTQSYGASGDQSRAVVNGLKADYVAFSLAPDVDRLVKANLVAPTWNAGPYGGMVTKSVVVFVVRKGNPKNIKTWDDVIKPGVDVITPNPFTSGSARWNVMAAYGQAQAAGGDAAGTAYLTKLFEHVSVQDDSGRKALQTFTSGKGDVLLAYENEAIFAQQNHQAVDYVVPDRTILIENPAAVTTASSAAAKAFLAYVHTKPAQVIFAKNGYRPVLPGVTGPYPFPTPKGLFTIASLGGWTAVTKRFFDPQGSLLAQIEKGKGVPVAK